MHVQVFCRRPGGGEKFARHILVGRDGTRPTLPCLRAPDTVDVSTLAHDFWGWGEEDDEPPAPAHGGAAEHELGPRDDASWNTSWRSDNCWKRHRKDRWRRVAEF